MMCGLTDRWRFLTLQVSKDYYKQTPIDKQIPAKDLGDNTECKTGVWGREDTGTGSENMFPENNIGAKLNYLISGYVRMSETV